ncbi:MAG: hypothetical protein IK073_01255 [Paludibacteraceae bacterium]|nr:hypothetical protein [Paludibacteraceae bacterium]
MKRLLCIVLLCWIVRPLLAAEPMDTIQLAVMMENRQYAEVVRLTTRELSRFPKNGALYYYRARAQVEQQAIPEALDDLRQAIRYHKDVPATLPEMYIMRAGLYVQIDDTTAAFADYTQAIQRAGKHPHNARYYVYRASAYAYYERYEEAAEDYHTASEIEPENASFKLELARYQALSGKTAQARQLLEDLCALHPEQIEAPYLLAAILCYVEEDYTAAVDWIITSLTRRYLADKRIGETDILFIAGAIDYAYVYRALSDEIHRYEAMEQYGLRDVFYLLRSQLLHQQGYSEDELADLDSVSAFSLPREYEEWLDATRLQCYVSLRRWKEVVQRSSDLIRLHEETASYYLVRGIAYTELEQFAAAETDLQRAHTLQPGKQTALALGSFYHRRHRYADAVDAFTQLLQMADSAEMVYAHLVRGQAYLGMRDTTAANSDFAYVLAHDTTYRNSFRHYALCRMGRNAEAIAWANRIIREYPEAENYYNLACLYAIDGQPERALEYLETAFRWGYTEPRQVLWDDDLNSLRSLPDFQSLVQRYVPSLPSATKSSQKQDTKTKKK